MKGIPVIRSRLSLPQASPTVVVSERLQRLSDGMDKRRAVIITAPAGYGKTTLVVTALTGYKSKGCKVRWYRLDEQDRDPAAFYTHLVEMLFPEQEGVWAEPRGYLTDYGDIFSRHQYLNALICQELSASQRLRPDLKTFIVFDDYHQVRDAPEITGAIQFFIDNLPDNYVVIVNSRCETGLLTGKRRLENTLEITGRELCFSEDELAVLIKERCGMIPEPDLLKQIMQQTEGWAAGIILVIQMLNRSGTGEARSVLDRSEGKELFFQYIATEVLRTLDEHLLQFLAQAVILHEFTAAEAITIFAADNAPQLLEECVQKGLFLQRIPGEATTYRFHSLFREALRQIQPRYLSPEEVKDYHRRAAAYYMEHQMFDRAIEHFITGGDIDSAVALVGRESAKLIAYEDVDQLRLWFKLLPEEVVWGNGFLLYIKAFINNHKTTEDVLHLLERAHFLFQQANEHAMQIHAVVHMSALHAQRNDMLSIKKLHAQISSLSEAVPVRPIQDMLAVYDFCVAICEERLDEGAALYRRVKSLAKDLDDEWQWHVLFFAAVMHGLLGDLDRAERLFRETLEMNLIKRAELLRGYTQVFYAVYLLMQDNHEAFSPVLGKMMAIGEKRDYKCILGFGNRLAAFAGYRDHDLESALELLDTSTDHFAEMGNTALVSSNKLYRCLWQCRRNHSPELLSAAKEALDALLAAPSGICLQEIGLSVFGAVAREAGAYELSRQSLEAAVQRSKAKGAKQVLSGACLHLAKLCYDTGDPAGGEHYLRQAFNLAVENKYVMFWDLHFPTLVAMAARCVKSRIHADYAKTLIARYYGTEAVEFLGRAATLTTDDQMQNLVAAFLTRYGARKEAPAPRISVTLFGRFGIAVNGITIPESEWKTQKIAGVLKFLVAHRGRPVAKDRLMEAFWPGADKKSASMSLWAALYELNKVLRKYGEAPEEQGSLLNKKRDSLEVRVGSLLAVDVDEFLALADELKKLPPGNNNKTQKKTILEKMVALYRGDFLEEDVYEDWTFTERETLRSVYFGSVMELAGINITDKDHQAAEKLLLRAFSLDQHNEEVCLNLLKLYMATNQRSRAVKLYANFADRFEKELGLKPDEQLASLIMDKSQR